MSAKRSRRTLWLGLGLIIIGLAGMNLFHSSSFGPASFSGWGHGGVYDKGSYASNGERIYYLGVDSEGRRIRSQGGPHWLRMMGGSCVNCHGQNGRGGFPVMMGTHTPGDIRYSSLVSGKHHDEEEGEKGEAEVYTDEDIRRAIRDGLEPSGKTLDHTMPRWRISDKDLTDLIQFLKELE